MAIDIEHPYVCIDRSADCSDAEEYNHGIIEDIDPITTVATGYIAGDDVIYRTAAAGLVMDGVLPFYVVHAIEIRGKVVVP